MLTWAKANVDGPSHAWPANQPGDLWTALCGVQACPDDLIETTEDECVRCVLFHNPEREDVIG